MRARDGAAAWLALLQFLATSTSSTCSALPAVGARVPAAQQQTLMVDRAENSSPGDCSTAGQCSLSAALLLARPGTELTVELTVDSVGVGMAVLPGSASVSVVGKMPVAPAARTSSAAAAAPALAKITGGFGTLFRVPAVCQPTNGRNVLWFLIPR
jgi:hypothetical protein